MLAINYPAQKNLQKFFAIINSPSLMKYGKKNLERRQQQISRKVAILIELPISKGVLYKLNSHITNKKKERKKNKCNVRPINLLS